MNFYWHFTINMAQVFQTFLLATIVYIAAQVIAKFIIYKSPSGFRYLNICRFLIGFTSYWNWKPRVQRGSCGRLDFTFYWMFIIIMGPKWWNV